MRLSYSAREMTTEEFSPLSSDESVFSTSVRTRDAEHQESATSETYKLGPMHSGGAASAMCARECGACAWACREYGEILPSNEGIEMVAVNSHLGAV